MTCEMTPAAPGDSISLIGIVRYPAADDILPCDPATLGEERPKSRGKNAADIIGMSIDETDFQIFSNLIVAARP